jgi:transcription antitermination protein NusB
MGRRTKARECAFQMLYQAEITGEPIDAVSESFWKIRAATEAGRALAERLARGAHAASERLDRAIAEHATHWRFPRIAAVDRNILRLGAYELENGETPPAVVLDEAIELAKRFGEADSPAFVNGVLDAILRAGSPGAGPGKKSAKREKKGAEE